MPVGAETSLGTVRLDDGAILGLAHAHEDDAPALLEYLEAIAHETDFLTFGPGEFGIGVDEEREFIRSLADRSRGLMIKATLGERVAGLATLGRSPRPRLRHEAVLGISVLQRHWGCGVGRALMDALFAEGLAAGITRIALTVRADNLRAVRLYERLGFAHEGRAVGSMIVGGQQHDVLHMAHRR